MRLLKRVSVALFRGDLEGHEHVFRVVRTSWEARPGIDAVTWKSRQEVNVEVVNGLLGITSAGMQNVHSCGTKGIAVVGGQILDEHEDRGEIFLWYSEEVLDMTFWNDQGVASDTHLPGQKGHGLVCLLHDESWFFACHDSAKHTAHLEGPLVL